MPVSSQEPSCACVHTPRTRGRVTGKPPPRPSAVESIPVSPFLWPRLPFQRAVTEKFQPCAVRTLTALQPVRSLIRSVVLSMANLLEGASHALLASLGSCAHRIGDRGVSCVLDSLKQGLSS